MLLVASICLVASPLSATPAPAPEAYFQSLRSNHEQPSELESIKILEKLSVTNPQEKGIALLFYDFADSQLGFSHMRMLFNGKAYEMDNAPDEHGQFVRERNTVESLVESRPGALPTAILWLALDEETSARVSEALKTLGHESTKYSLLNKLIDQKSLNCAGFIQEVLFAAQIITEPLSRYTISPDGIYRHFKNSIPGIVELKVPPRKLWQAIFASNIRWRSLFPRKIISPLIGQGHRIRFVLAQQQLSAKDIVKKALGIFLKAFNEGANWSNLKDSIRGSVLELVTLQIPLSDLPVYRISSDLSEEAKAFLFFQKGEETYLRFFIHPGEIDHYADLIERYPSDRDRWLGIPTTSAGDLIVVNAKNPEARTGIELSLFNVKKGIDPSIIDPARAKHAVMISDLIAEIRKTTGGKIPGSDKTWEFIPESFATAAPAGHRGGFIFRDFSMSSIDDFIVVPLSSLMTKRDNMDAWFNELLRYSGHKSRLEFVWQDLVAPLTALNAEIEYQEGISSDLQPKNINVKIDPNTRRVVGFMLGDADSFTIDHSLRVHRLGKSAIPGSFEENAQDFSYGKAQARVFTSYAKKLRNNLIKDFFVDHLESPEMTELIRRADRLTLERFSLAFPEYHPQNLVQLHLDIVDLNAKSTTVEESLVYSHLQPAKKISQTTRVLQWLGFDTTNKAGVQTRISGSHPNLAGATSTSQTTCEALFIN